MRKYLLIFLTFCFAHSLFSQLDNSALQQNLQEDTIHDKQLYIKIQNLDYMKDNEYFGPIADGYTLFGTQLNPQLGYKLSKYLSIEAGVFLMKDFGNKNFTTIAPTYSLRYCKNDFKMIFGNINGSINHNLIEPLYNFERVITNRLENGAQFMINKKHFDFDTWVDWQNMIYNQSNAKERIYAGINLNAYKLKLNKLELSIPLQATVLHSGGQIDTSKTRDYMNLNYTAGVALKYNVNSKHVQSIFLDARYVADRQEIFDTVVLKNNGDGFLGDFGITAFHTNILFSYWYGNNYASDYGGFIYRSMSSTVHFSNSYENYRSLLIMRVTKTFTLAPHVLLTLRAEPYYDFRLKLFEYALGFYINFDDKFWFNKK